MQPDIYFGPLRIAEPGIALTGLFIGLLCYFAWARLRRRADLLTAQVWMTRFFGFMAISATVGPFFGHAFNYWAGFTGKYICWIFSMLSLAALAQAAIEHARPALGAGISRWMSGANALALAAGLLVTGIKQSFPWVEGHSALILFGFLAPLEGLVYAKNRNTGSLLLLVSLPLTVLAVLPHVFKWSPDVWFTYYDVGHVMLYGCFWVMLVGAEQMRPLTPDSKG